MANESVGSGLALGGRVADTLSRDVLGTQRLYAGMEAKKRAEKPEYAKLDETKIDGNVWFSPVLGKQAAQLQNDFINQYNAGVYDKKDPNAMIKATKGFEQLAQQINTLKATDNSFKDYVTAQPNAQDPLGYHKESDVIKVGLSPTATMADFVLATQPHNARGIKLNPDGSGAFMKVPVYTPTSKLDDKTDYTDIPIDPSKEVPIQKDPTGSMGIYNTYKQLKDESAKILTNSLLAHPNHYAEVMYNHPDFTPDQVKAQVAKEVSDYVESKKKIFDGTKQFSIYHAPAGIVNAQPQISVVAEGKFPIGDAPTPPTEPQITKVAVEKHIFGDKLFAVDANGNKIKEFGSPDEVKELTASENEARAKYQQDKSEYDAKKKDYENLLSITGGKPYLPANQIHTATLPGNEGGKYTFNLDGGIVTTGSNTGASVKGAINSSKDIQVYQSPVDGKNYALIQVPPKSEGSVTEKNILATYSRTKKEVEPGTFILAPLKGAIEGSIKSYTKNQLNMPAEKTVAPQPTTRKKLGDMIKSIK